MGIFDGFLDKMKLSSDDDYDDELDEELDEDDDDVEPAPKKSRVPAKPAKESFEEEKKAESFAKPKVAPKAPAPTNRVVRYNKGNGMEVCVFKPTNIEEGREIADTLLDGKAVILNLEGIDVNLAQRIIDFTSGSCYSIRGNLQKVANYIFIVTPESVDISGDFQELITTNDLGFRTGNGF